MMVYSSLFASLIVAGSYITFPFPSSPVPVSLQSLFVLLAGLLLGRKWGTASVAIYLLAGAVGLPVFAKGMGGIGHFVAPTGGYLVGFIPAAFVIGFFAEKKKSGATSDVIAMIAGSLIIYIAGIFWLKIHTGLSLSKTIVAGMVPFLPGDAMKIAAAVFVANILRPVINLKETRLKK